MFKRLLLVSSVALALSLAAFGSYSVLGHKGHAEAARLINCTVDSSAAPHITVTCTGTIHIVTPFATVDRSFSLVVDAIDNPPTGPSFGDQIIGCTLGVNGAVPTPIHVGPCP
jgi:hypothetical protein